MSDGIIMCIVGAVVALAGCFFERLPRGMISFRYFRKEEDVPQELMCKSKVWLIATGVAAAVVAAVGIGTKIYWFQLFIPLAILLAGAVAIYALWLRDTPKSVRYVVWPALVVTLGMVFYMLLQGFAQTQVEVDGSVLRIKGLYSLEIPCDEIARIDLRSEPPQVTLRTNGFAANGICKGYFKFENGERCFLSTDAGIDTYIYIYRKNDFPVVLNVGDESQTERFYEQLKQEIRK